MGRETAACRRVLPTGEPSMVNGGAVLYRLSSRRGLSAAGAPAPLPRFGRRLFSFEIIF